MSLLYSDGYRVERRRIPMHLPAWTDYNASESRNPEWDVRAWLAKRTAICRLIPRPEANLLALIPFFTAQRNSAILTRFLLSSNRDRCSLYWSRRWGTSSK